jgi:hypothetical protein
MVRMREGPVVRLPLQGGLPPMEDRAGPVVEIACDESGFSGTNLLDAATPVITHASVDLCLDEAAELVGRLRSGFRFPLEEFKSGHLLRDPQAETSLAWFLAELRGRAQVQVVDKEYFLVTRIVDLFLAEPSYAAGTRLSSQHRPAALALYRARRSASRDWDLFLAAFVDLVRTRRRHRPDRPDPPGHTAVQRFFRARDALIGPRLGTAAVAVLDDLSPGRVRAVLTRLAHDDRSIPPPLEPMLPALAETVLSWSGGTRRVRVVHDEQSALTADRLRRLQQVLAHRPEPSPLAGLVMVDSRDDPRVQVADLLAGLSRRSAESGDAELLRSFVSGTSLHDPER